MTKDHYDVILMTSFHVGITGDALQKKSEQLECYGNASFLKVVVLRTNYEAIHGFVAPEFYTY